MLKTSYGWFEFVRWHSKLKPYQVPLPCGGCTSQFWQEIKERFKTIEFVGSHGLGVVFLGEVPDGKLHELFQISENGKQAQIHGTFGSISDDVIQAFRMRDSAIAERDSAIAERDKVLNSTIWKTFKLYRWLRSKI